MNELLCSAYRGRKKIIEREKNVSKELGDHAELEKIESSFVRDTTLPHMTTVRTV